MNLFLEYPTKAISNIVFPVSLQMITFDDSPVLYWWLGMLLFITATILTVVTCLNNQQLNRKWLVKTAVFLQLLLIFYFRLPTIVFNEALNPDENLFIVGALTLAKSPLYWESVDGCTSGPFNFYIITAFCELFGQPYDYISARIVGVSLMIGACLFSFLALQILFSASIALLSLFPAVAFLGLTKYWDFINYSSEQLPIFLMSVMLYLFAKMYISKTHIKRSDLFIYGFISGSVIFTKLQAIPIAFCLTLMGYWLIFLNKKKDFLKNTIILTAGGSITLVVFMLVGYYYNFLDKIWIFYFKNNLYYGNESLSITKSILASLNDPINIFIRIILLISCISIFYRIVIKRQFRLNTLSVLLVLFTVGTIISVYKTGFIFHHYLLFLICPSVFLFAFLLNDASKITKKPLNVGFSIMATIFVVLKTNTVSFSNYLISADKPQRPLSISQTGHQILKYSRPSESIVIWGDAGRLYLETKRTQGIRWSNTHWGMYSDSLQKNFQNEFISELKEKPYPVFVDAHPIKNTFMTRDKIGYETNQKLKEYIDKNYRLIGDFNEQRVFIHNERLAEMNTSI